MADTLTSNVIASIDRVSKNFDLIYQREALTADLETTGQLVTDSVGVHKVRVPVVSMSGLGDYSKTTGYPEGAIKSELKDLEPTYDRGRKLSLDAVDNEETFGLLFGTACAEMLRTKVIPEADAWHFSQLAQKADSDNVIKGGSITTGANVILALRAGIQSMDEAEVGDNRILYITPTLMGLVEDLDTTKSKAVLSRFTKIVRVPQTRFYSKIKLYDGTTTGQKDGGYIKDDTTGALGYALNFMIIERNAPVCFTKHIVQKYITPMQNQTMDAWLFFLRSYGICDINPNKKNGVYVNTAQTA